MKKARPTSKQRFKNAGRNPTRTTTPVTQSDGYQGNSKLRYETANYDIQSTHRAQPAATPCVKQIKNRRE